MAKRKRGYRRLLFIFSRNRGIHGVRMHGLPTVLLCVRRDVHDNSAATSFAHVCSMQAGNTIMRVRSVSKLAFLSVTDTYTYLR